MTAYGYSYVSDKGFVAFSRDLSEGAWKGVSIAKYDTPDKGLSASTIDASHPVIWKLRTTWAIAALKQALGSSTLEELDRRPPRRRALPWRQQPRPRPAANPQGNEPLLPSAPPFGDLLNP